MSDDPNPRLHPDLEAARYGPKRDGDRFVGLWLNLAIEARHERLRPVSVRTRRLLERFWSGREVQAALAAVGTRAFNEQLRDAAEVYFTSCLTDPQYSSTMWRMNRIEPDKLRDRMARDTANMMALLADSGALTGEASQLPALLTDGLLRVLAPHGAEELAAAVARNPSAVRAMEMTEQE